MEITVETYSISYFSSEFVTENYSVVLWKGSGVFCVDDINYAYSGYTILFLSPYQKLKLISENEENVNVLFFHGDFYV